MPKFIHFAPQKLSKRIKRSGLRGGPADVRVSKETIEHQEVVFAMPMLRDFQQTHQWLREMRRWRPGKLVAVHFRLPADTEVYWGDYHETKQLGPLSLAIRDIARDPTGKEIVIPSRIAKKNICCVRQMRQDVGWSYSPSFPRFRQCACCWLDMGQKNSQRKLRGHRNNNFARILETKDPDELENPSRFLEMAFECREPKLKLGKVRSLLKHPDFRPRRAVAYILGQIDTLRHLDILEELSMDRDFRVRKEAIHETIHKVPPKKLLELFKEAEDQAQIASCLEFCDAPETDEVLEMLARSPDPDIAEEAQASIDSRLNRED